MLLLDDFLPNMAAHWALAKPPSNCGNSQTAHLEPGVGRVKAGRGAALRPVCCSLPGVCRLAGRAAPTTCVLVTNGPFTVLTGGAGRLEVLEKQSLVSQGPAELGRLSPGAGSGPKSVQHPL